MVLNHAARAPLVLCLLSIIATQGCAVSYTDKAGDRHVIGLVDVTLRHPPDNQTFAGDVVELTTFGLSAGRTAQGGYLTAGYNHEVTAELRDNALVIGNPVERLAGSQQGRAGDRQ